MSSQKKGKHMKIKTLIAASLIALGSVPYLSQAQQAAATQADLQALPPALRAALLSGNPAQIEQAITTLSGGNPAQAATLAGLVARAASFVAQTNPRAAAAGAQASAAVANRPAVIAANPAAAAQIAISATRIALLPSMASGCHDICTVRKDALGVRHHDGEAAVGGGDAGDAVGRAVRVEGIGRRHRPWLSM
jgi:hypothetical protein